MRLLAGASLSVVNSGTCLAMRLKASIEVFGSTEEIMMALVPPATRSSISAFCSAAVPWAGYLNWSSYFGNSPCAFLTPASASFQKSEDALTTNASFFSCAEAGVALNASAAVTAVIPARLKA